MRKSVLTLSLLAAVAAAPAYAQFGGTDVAAKPGVTGMQATGLGAGIMANPPKDGGFIGRSVVDADGVALGSVTGIGGKNSASAPQVFVRTADGAKTVALKPSDLSANGSGQLMASGISRSQIATLPATTVPPVDQKGFTGKTVFSADNVELGNVDNVMLDPKSGMISSLILSGGASGQGGAAIDHSLVVADASGKLSTPSLTGAQFKAALASNAAAEPGKAVTQ